ncbi:T-complex protein 11-like protein 1 [Teleopsis dalmanni]|uniref:T-complex protein 11-like protein 1 n=1 Tax=Teleopsis dalmanni TaxID=139649 RepID=UPI0018CFDA8B|nr:T-complex protein 11-like protein 1 [Teleopsis dalmanni]XP_037937285.1 T-complex protein 11-like protein 1 [Teleopsis dalmanni]
MPADSVSRMDSNSSNNEQNLLDNILGTSPGAKSLRERTESESSDKLARFVLPSMDGSPPKILTLNELSTVLKNIQNMELAHEIALNPEFKLEPYEPPEDSLESRIKEIMHKAFWDLLREQLQQDPPCYDHAIQLLTDIKECFPQILSPKNMRALDRIDDVLDADVIRQQAEKGVLDFRSYALFVIDMLSKLCAPARDETVQNLKKIEDVVDTFKGILETMSLMKLDMANYLIDFARNDIMANSVEYEKEKFKEYLQIYKFGFPATENWLKRNRTLDDNNVPCTAEQAINNAYIDLVDWSEENKFPEVLSMDKDRLLKFTNRANRLCACASLIALSSALPIISQRTDNRVALAKQIEVLMQDVITEKDMSEAITNIFEQIKSFINKCLNKENQPNVEEETLNLLKMHIMQIADKNSSVRTLMMKRLKVFFRLGMRSNAGLPAPPPGFEHFKDELEAYTTALKRVIKYNHNVFGDYFLKVLTQERQVTETSTTVENTESNN